MNCIGCKITVLFLNMVRLQDFIYKIQAKVRRFVVFTCILATMWHNGTKNNSVESLSVR